MTVTEFSTLVMDDFTNEEVATVVSYTIAFNKCEEAMRRFKSKFGKEGPKVRTLWKWLQRYDSWCGVAMILFGTVPTLFLE